MEYQGRELSDKHHTSIAVLSSDQDDAGFVNTCLREAGHAAHCLWIATPGRFADALGKESIELIILNVDNYSDDVQQVIKQKDDFIPEVPVIAIGQAADEVSILRVMRHGVCDLVPIEQKVRLQAVINRELRAYRMERALNDTLISTTEYRKQLHYYMQTSRTAVAYVREGIVTDVNNAWLELFAAGDKDEVVGMPLMNHFLEESHTAIKGAMVATAAGKWQEGELLEAKASKDTGDEKDLALSFQLSSFGDEPQVQIRIEPSANVPQEPARLVHDALERDPTSLFYHRAQFLERVAKRLKRNPKSGMYALAYIKPDDFSGIRRAVGILDSEKVLTQFAEEIRKQMHYRDFAGRFEGTAIMALIERGNERDAEAWGRQLVEHMKNHEFTNGDNRIKLTCTVGIVGVSGAFSTLEELVAAAADAHATGKNSGGNTAALRYSTDIDTRIRKHDEIWIQRIKDAMADNRFQLAQLPIAGLRSETRKMYDILIRMIDEKGNSILPSELLPAAERNNLMTVIDRWIIRSSLEFCKEHDAERVFVRLSRQSIQDSSLVSWVIEQMRSFRVDPEKLVVQVPEQEAARYIKDTKAMSEALRVADVQFALEHYGVDKNRFQILDILKPNFIKIDGELMHSLMTDTALQESVRLLAQTADERNIETIAERVENANAMAVLFQAGVHFMQGHYVHEPEVVLQEPVQMSTTLEAVASR